VVAATHLSYLVDGCVVDGCVVAGCVVAGCVVAGCVTVAPSRSAYRGR